MSLPRWWRIDGARQPIEPGRRRCDAARRARRDRNPGAALEESSHFVEVTMDLRVVASAPAVLTAALIAGQAVAAAPEPAPPAASPPVESGVLGRNLGARATPVPTELACYKTVLYPHAATVDTFNNGDTVYFVADPFKLATLPGITCRVYVTRNRAWAFGDPLVDARGFPQTNTFTAGSILLNIFPLVATAGLPFDALEDIGVGYDVVIDADNSGTLTPPDYIDGPGREGGFYKIRDLTTANAATAVTQVNLVSIPAGRTTPGYESERWYYPSNIAARGRIPLVIISHGNGHNYAWYDYLGQHLASYGYIVISHANNTPPGIPTAAQTLIDHTNTIIDLQAVLGGGVLNGHIDGSRLVWIGHSRGGEGVAYGYNRLSAGLIPPTGGFPLVFSANDVRIVSSIAPTDFMGTGLSDPMKVDYHLIYGAADGDVSGVPYSDLADSFNVYERAAARRNATYVHGADHNDFNCCGFNDFVGCPGTDIGPANAQAVAKAEWLALIKHELHGNIPCKEVLWRQYENLRPIGVSPKIVVDREFKDLHTGFPTPSRFIIDDLQANPSPLVSSSGGGVTFNVMNLFEGLMDDTDGAFSWNPADPMNGMTRNQVTDSSNGVVFDYDNSLATWFIQYDVVPGGQDVTRWTYLSFRAAQITRHPWTTAYNQDQNFQVMLIDGWGNSSAIDVGAYFGSVEEPYCRDYGWFPGDVGPGTGWQDEFETCRVRLTDFCADGRFIDLTNIKYLVFLFGGNHGEKLGRLALDDIEWVRK